MMQILIVLVVAAVIAGLYVWTLVGTMSNVESQKQANVYMVENSFNLDTKKDRFMYSNVVKTPKPQNNGQGGPGGRGGGPRGGGPRGGGGGGRH